jgi:hypothetical protein
MVLNRRRDIENGVRALLREARLKVGTPSRKDFSSRVRELIAGDAMLADLVGSLLSVIDVMSRDVGQLTKLVLDEVRLEPPALARSPPSRSARLWNSRLVSVGRGTWAHISV